MTACEMCGKSTSTIKAIIEGADLLVCSSCVSLGMMKKNKLISSHLKPLYLKKKEEEFTLKPSFTSLIATARREKAMSQKDFAQFLQEKESLVAKWERGVVIPSFPTVKKLEKKLNVSLFQKENQRTKTQIETKKEAYFTIGDAIKISNRKK